MKTVIGIAGEKFTINGKPTYEGKKWKGHPIEGLLFNSRMIQAIFDDENPETRDCWKYPDTREWDPERNTREFCAMLPEYKRHGMLGFTVGLQGGGSIYTPEIYEAYDNSAFTPEGNLKEAYFERLARILKAADQNGMAAIINYFYWQHARRFKDAIAIKKATVAATDWLLETGYENILVDVVNESSGVWKVKGIEQCAPEHVHELIAIVKGRNLDDRRLLAGSSSSGGLLSLPFGKWLDTEDFSMPHGNGCTPEILKMKIQSIREETEYQTRPRPILVNEDSIFVENLEAAVEEYASWGFYCQGYGSKYQDRMNWKTRAREEKFEDLSGFQTVPVNWSINTGIKNAFFDKLRGITREKKE